MRNRTLTKSNESAAAKGRLLVRPSHLQTNLAPDGGLHSLSFSDKRQALLYIPVKYKPETPAPLVLMLHGAGGSARHGIELLQNFADEFGIILLAPKSLHATWDVIADEYGADVEFIDGALGQVFERCNVDSSRLAIGGFSDGASYALSLGITNGNFFSHIIAFSPGFMAPTVQIGEPRIYISHGTGDSVLPIDRCSRRIVPQLKKSGYDVTYREFEGAHTIPPEINRAAVEWFSLKTH
jgi:predicted esterase